MLTVHIFSKIINKHPLLFKGNCASRKIYVNLMWNAREISMWNSCEKSTHTNSPEIFHIIFAWKRFYFKTVWKSGELSYEFYLKFTWTFSPEFNFTRITRVFFMKLHTKSRETLLRKVHVRHNWLWYNITKMWTLSCYPRAGTYCDVI